MRTLLAVPVAAMMHAAAAQAAEPVTISGAWARATLPHQNATVAYMTLMSPTGDELTGAESKQADMVMLHQTRSANGMSGMSDMDSLTLPPGKTIALAPEGMHIMVSGLKDPLAAGARLHLVLHFGHAGPVPVDVPVLPQNATGPR